jgi:Xaa-Pro aminopeptidase
MLLERLPTVGADALVVSHPPNIRYLTGFTGSAGLVVIGDSGCTLLTDFRYREQAESEVGREIRVDIVPRDLWGAALKLVGESRSPTRWGYEAHIVTAQTAIRLSDREQRPVGVPTSGLVEALRERKDSAEVAAIELATGVAAGALQATIPEIRVGLRELDIAAALERELRLRGSEWHPFQTIVASGPRSALPHARTTDRVIEAGDWLLLDFGAQVNGYCADLTRTLVVGRPADSRQRLVYDLVRQAQFRAREHMRAGMSGREADALARSVFEGRGFADAFGHSLGHGLGLEVHEAPSVSWANEKPLPDGCVVTVEPGLYFPGWGGVRLEDDVYLTSDGARMLSDGQVDLLELT